MAFTQVSTDGIKNGTITGSDLATNIDLVDNQKLRVGAGNDLQLYHDGTNSYLENNTGSLLVQGGGQIIYLQAVDHEDGIRINPNGSVQLFNDGGAATFETTSDGVKSTGQADLHSDSGSALTEPLMIRNGGSGAGTNVGMVFFNGDGTSTGAGALAKIKAIDVGSFDADLVFETALKSGFSTGGTAERLRITSTGDLRIPFVDNSTGLRQKIQFVTEGNFFDEVGYIAMDRTAVSSAPSDMVFATGTAGSATQKMRIDSSGRLLLGLTSGTSALLQVDEGAQVFGAANDGNSSCLTMDYASSTGRIMGHGSSGGELAFFTNASGSGVSQRLTIKSDGKVDLNADPGKFGNSHSTGTTYIFGNDIRFTNADITSTTMTVKSSGNVGIGTTSPGARLTIEGAADNVNSELRLTATGVASGYLGSDSNGLNIGTDTNRILFKTAVTGGGSVGATGTVRMQIHNSSFISIGTSDNIIYNHSSGDDNGVVFDGDGTIQVARTNDQCMILNRMGTDGTVLSFHNDGSCVGYVGFSGATTTYSPNCSDRTLKKNFGDWTEDTLSLFKDITPQTFNFLTEQDTDTKHKGFIAQNEVDKFPEAYPKIRDDKYWFDPMAMVPYLMKAIQELEAEVAALKAS